MGVGTLLLSCFVLLDGRDAEMVFEAEERSWSTRQALQRLWILFLTSFFAVKAASCSRSGLGAAEMRRLRSRPRGVLLHHDQNVMQVTATSTVAIDQKEVLLDPQGVVNKQRAKPAIGEENKQEQRQLGRISSSMGGVGGWGS